ncbi:arginase family protein [Pollutibacter soli]|uniref:arginase family protein n=1 Tax=Pollutibacter soli TaxID=3034157 RepID=UPI00301404BE
MKYFKFYNRQDLLNHTRLRRYETKLGEKLKVFDQDQNYAEQLRNSSAKFVLFGIPECIGVIANQGIPGTETLWPAFFPSFVNIQSTDKFNGPEVLLAGHFDFSEVLDVINNNSKSQEEKVDACRHAVANIIDESVEEFVKMIVAAGKIPIAIGGGHNNCYPLIKGTAKALAKSGNIPQSKINAVNVDAHADYRIMEGRHSGNGFRYAMEESYLGKYAVIGLHENYNPQSMLDDLYSNINAQYVFYEDIFLQERLNFTQAVAQAFSFTDDNITGVELDLDAVERIPSSASSPSGISVMHARQYMCFAGHHGKTGYVHICEGAMMLQQGILDPLMGKLPAYLVADFVKASLD